MPASALPSGPELAALVAEMAAAGQLPPELAALVTPGGMVLLASPETGELIEVHPNLLQEFRQVLAQRLPEYALRYYWGVSYELGRVYQVPALPTLAMSWLPGPTGETYAYLAPPAASIRAGTEWARALRVGAAPLAAGAAVGARFVAPVIPGPPPVMIVSAIISAVGALFGIFRGGVSGAVKTALEGMRAVITTVTDGLLRFAWSIARALGKVLQAFQAMWTRVIWPMLRAIPRIAGRLHRVITRDLPRLLRAIERLRQKLLEIYEKYARPMLVVIQRLRKLLLILRLFRIKWAEKLDAQLVRLQERIMLPLKVALEHLALVEQWLNVVVSAEQLIQETIWNNSVFHYQDPLMRSWMGAVGRPMDPLRRKELYPSRAAVSAEDSREHLRLALLHGTGPVAEDARRAVAELRRLRGA